MSIINIQAAKTHLSRIVEQAAKGEEIILAKAGKPMVKLVPISAPRKPRTGGQLKGQIWVSPTCWEADGELLAQMTESPLYPVRTDDDEGQKVAEGTP